MNISFPKFIAVLTFALFLAAPVMAADEVGSEAIHAPEQHSVDFEPMEEIVHEVGEAVYHAAEASGEHHGEAGGLPQMDVSWYPSQIFWVAITFICLYLIFANKLLPEISSTLENRRAQIEGDINSADELRAEAEEVQKTYEEMLLKSREEASALFAKVEEDIRKKTAKKTQSSMNISQRKIAETEEAIDAAKKSAMGEMHSIAAELASIATEKIIGVSTDINQAKDLVKTLDKKKAA